MIYPLWDGSTTASVNTVVLVLSGLVALALYGHLRRIAGAAGRVSNLAYSLAGVAGLWLIAGYTCARLGYHDFAQVLESAGLTNGRAR